MSILIIEALYEGLIFGADRNITVVDSKGVTSQQHQWPKVLKWPNENTLFGYAGAATLDNKPVHEWLEEKKQSFSQLGSLENVASQLKHMIEKQRSLDEGNRTAEAMIVHVGSFGEKNGHIVPYVYYISNVYKMGQFGYLDCRKEFQCSEEFWRFNADIDPSEIRRNLKVRAKRFEPFWFHHGIDLITFNVLEGSIRASFKLLCENHPNHDIPNRIADWEKHVKMQVLMYAAYYEAFYPKNSQFVGGGADVISIPWPRQ